MTRFRNPGHREAAWGRHYARRGVTAADVLADERPPYPADRERQWRIKYDRLPVEMKVRHA